MNNVLEMLAKAGYEVSSIGNDVIPCTLQRDGQPAGFLLEDLSVRLLPEFDSEREKMESIIAFTKDNQGLETINEGECVLSQYQDVKFTAVIDFETGKPYYNIYYEDENKELILRNSFHDKTDAARDFASRSGLVPEDILLSPQIGSRIDKFVEMIKKKGFKLSENRKEANRAFDITDKDGKVVGYIGKNNRVTITTQNEKNKRILSNAYIETNSEFLLLPSFFEKLKERLKEIGLALKVIFTAKGRHYAIHNQKQQEVATVNEQNHQVTYTDIASPEERAKIDVLVEELRRENQERQNPEKDTEREVPENQIRNTRSAAKEGPAFTPDDMQNLTEAILSDNTMTNTLFGLLLSNQEFISRLNSDLAEKLQLLTPFREITNPDVQRGQQQEQASLEVKQQENIEKEPASQERNTESKKNSLTPQQKQLSDEFYKQYSMLMTYDGFNPEKYASLEAQMTDWFGTADLKEFDSLLQQGKYDTLKEKLKTSQRTANLENAQNKAEPEKEQKKERV